MSKLVNFAVSLLAIVASWSSVAVSQAEILLDEVVASVDGNPITLKDISLRIPGRPVVRTSDLSTRGAASDALNALIEEWLVSAEATERKISVSDSDVSSYIAVVAQQNNLSTEGFEQALAERGIDREQYRKQIKYEILRSKVASAVAQTVGNVSEEELASVVGEEETVSEDEDEENRESLSLRQIVIYREGKTPEEFEAKVANVAKKLLSADTFSEVARKESESAERSEGGSLGVVQVADLSETIQEAIEPLKPGQISKPLIGPDAARFFMVDNRGASQMASAQKSILEDARAHLKQGKAMAKIDEFFTKTIREKHIVEKYFE